MKKTLLVEKGSTNAASLESLPYEESLSYEEMANQPDALSGIRRGLAQAREGAGRPADDVFDDLEREDGRMTWRHPTSAAKTAPISPHYRSGKPLRHPK
jgi:hypothetical protein